MLFRDLKTQYYRLKKEIDASVLNVLDSSDYILGAPVTELESTLANYVGRKHCISCASGTDALQLALMALGIEREDAVFTSDFTYIASASTTSLLGGTPIFVDIDLTTFNMDPMKLEEQIKRIIHEGRLRPRAIIPVDLFGQPANYDRILSIAKNYGLYVIEDAAQGFGGSIQGRMACSFGDLSITSFFPAKPLGCYGDGGAVFTNDDDLGAKIRSMRAHGRSLTDKYENQVIGLNSRLDTIQAAILLTKFKAFVDYELKAVDQIAKMYSKRLRDEFIVPYIPEGVSSSWAQYTILVKDRDEREYLRRILKEQGIPTMVYYPKGLHQQAVYKFMELPDEIYECSVEATNRAISLPMHPYLSEADVDLVCNTLLSAVELYNKHELGI